MSQRDIVEQVGRDLEGARYYQDKNRSCVAGMSSGREVRVRCRTGKLHAWTVETDVKHSPPLLLTARRKTVGEQALIDRGIIRAVQTGDADFENHHFVEAAPDETAKQVFDAEVRRALVTANGRVNLAVEEGTVSAGKGGEPYGAGDVRAGLSLALLLAERVEAVVAKRRTSPPSNLQIDRERAEIASLRVLRDRAWSRMTLPQLLFVIVMLGAAASVFFFGFRGC